MVLLKIQRQPTAPPSVATLLHSGRSKNNLMPTSSAAITATTATTTQICMPITIAGTCTPAAVASATAPSLCSSMSVACKATTTATLITTTRPSTINVRSTISTTRNKDSNSKRNKNDSNISTNSKDNNNANAIQSSLMTRLSPLTTSLSTNSWRSCIVGLVTLLVFTANFNISAGQIDWDDDDDPVSTVAVEAVLGRTATLPCDIEPEAKDDRVYMVLWFRESAGKPLYR
uniref:Ig-like domain-containing protein n=1 Tax=Ceratitis capitata TaxID=7213 RepID=W8BDQ3_CERCA